MCLCVRMCVCVCPERARERRRSQEEVSRWRAVREPTGSGGLMASSCCVGNCVVLLPCTCITHRCCVCVCVDVCFMCVCFFTMFLSRKPAEVKSESKWNVLTHLIQIILHSSGDIMGENVGQQLLKKSIVSLWTQHKSRLQPHSSYSSIFMKYKT